MIICPNCKKELNDNVKFCNGCGYRFNAAPAPDKQPQPTRPVVNETPKTAPEKAPIPQTQKPPVPQLEKPPASQPQKPPVAVLEKAPVQPEITSPVRPVNPVDTRLSPKKSKKPLVIGLSSAVVFVLVFLLIFIPKLRAKPAETQWYDSYASATSSPDVNTNKGLLDSIDPTYAPANTPAQTSTPLPTPDPTPVPTPTPEPVHYYGFIKSDVTWWKAYQSAIDAGGQLVVINSAEEFSRVTAEAYNAGIRVLWLGACRMKNHSWDETNWINGDYVLTDDGPIWNNGDSFKSTYQKWLVNEPSYTTVDGVSEYYLTAMYVKDEWVMNDTENDISVYYTDKMGYAIEYTN